MSWQIFKKLKNMFQLVRSRELLPYIKDSLTLSDKSEMLECLNEHFIASSSLFAALSPDKSSALNYHLESSTPICFWGEGQIFTLTQLSVPEDL